MIGGQLVTYPNKILKTKCEVVSCNEDNQELISNMWNAMRDLKGIGLAANQLGVSKQIFVMHQKVVQNPMVISRGKDMCVLVEGCLSFPGRKIRTKRAKVVEVSYVDRNFKTVYEYLYDLEAVVFQHEYDHLQGKTMLDREYNGRMI